MRTSRVIQSLAIALALAVTSVIAAQQTPPTITGVIRGRVVELITGQPIPQAAVAFRLEGSTGQLWATETDGDGHFVLKGVPGGAVEIRTSRPGYLDGAYGQRRPLGAGQAIELAGGQEINGVDVRMWKEASVSGQVFGPKNEPVAGVPVVAMRLVVDGARRYLQAAHSAETDASGRYDIRRISPATYAIALVSPPTDPPPAAAGGRTTRHPVRPPLQFPGYPTTYHPATTRADDALLIPLKSGEDREDIDFRLSASPAFGVTGSVSAVPRATFDPEVSLRLARRSAMQSTASLATARVGSDGRFHFPRVAPGAYVLRFAAFPAPFGSPDSTLMNQRVMGMEVRFTTLMFREGQPVAPLPREPAVWVELPVVVSDRDLTGLTLVVKPAAKVSGRVEFRGVSPLPTWQQLVATPVALMSADVPNLGVVPVGRIEANGFFTTVGVPPGRYTVEPMPTKALLGALAWNQTWRLESTMVHGRVVADGLIAVGDTDVDGVTSVFSDSSTEVTGIVRDVFGAVRPDATIYVFPADPGVWVRAREIIPTQAGRFKVSGLPLGDYFVAAATGQLPEHWNTHAFLGSLTASAERVALATTPQARVDLTVGARR